MRKKKRVLILSNCFLPGYRGGGPIQSITAMIEWLNQYFYFSIITADRDLGMTEPYADISINEWIGKEKYQVIYLSPKYKRIIYWIKLFRSFQDYDIIHLNSFFNYNFSILIILFKKIRLLNKNIVICPRGEFNGGALALKSIKKTIFIKVAKILGLYSNVRWHATNDVEAESIRTIFGKNVDISIAEALISARPLATISVKKMKGELRLVFLARISAIKNLEFLLKVIQGIDLKLDEKVTLDIYGPPEDKELLTRVELAIDNLNKKIGIRVQYKGDIKYEYVQETIAKYHFFILPTKGENFGQAIADALMAGCPVIISDKTPWRELEKNGIGWDLELNEDNFSKCIAHCLDIEDANYQTMRNNARQYVIKKSEDKDLIQRYVELLN